MSKPWFYSWFTHGLLMVYLWFTGSRFTHGVHGVHIVYAWLSADMDVSRISPFTTKETFGN